MRFLDALKEYLRGVERGLTREPAAAVDIDLPAARRHFLEAIERREQSEFARNYPLVGLTGLANSNGYIAGIVSELRMGLCAGSTRDELQRHTHMALDLLLGLPVEGLSTVRARELNRITTHAEQLADGPAPVNVERYAFELRATRVEAGATSISSIGRVLLGLPEADAVGWLLTLEAQQSLGEADGWRMSLKVIEHLQLHPEETYNPAEREGDDWPYHPDVLLRLEGLGVIDLWRLEDDFDWGYGLRPAFKPVIDDIAARKRTPLYVLAETLIADERDSLPTRALPATQPQQSAAEIQARHARMVVHEIRNALVPVRLALGTLYDSIDAGPSSESTTRSRERIDRGVERIFRFIDEMGRVAQLGVIAPSPFDVVEAIRDAIKGLNGGIQLDVEVTAGEGLAPVLGYRDRFTLAVVNLLRNAAQNSLKARAIVHLSAVLSASLDRVIVTVDDDGPGVPEASRDDIFQQGFALRAGGSGQGLALVREVVEMEMRGQVQCERGDLGGARFVLALPTATRESR